MRQLVLESVDSLDLIRNSFLLKFIRKGYTKFKFNDNGLYIIDHIKEYKDFIVSEFEVKPDKELQPSYKQVHDLVVGLLGVLGLNFSKSEPSLNYADDYIRFGVYKDFSSICSLLVVIELKQWDRDWVTIDGR